MPHPINRRDFAKTLTAAALASNAALQAQTQPAVLFHFSVMLWTVFNPLPFDQRLEKIAEAGYPSVELTGEWSKWSADDFARFNAKKHQLGMTFDASTGLQGGIADPALTDALPQRMKTALDLLARLECTSLIVTSGNKIEGAAPGAQHEACIENLSRASELAAKQNVTLLFENIDPEENPKYYLTSVAEGFDILHKVNLPNVKFLYDFYHEQIAEGNLIEKLQKNIDLVGVVHVADVPGRHEPGTGEINYANIFRKLAELKFSGTVAMEFRPLGEPVAALRSARDLALHSAAQQN